MSFAGLKDDITGAFNNAVSIVTDNADKPYPSKFESVTNVIQPSDRSWKKSAGYGFRVRRVNDGNIQDASEGWKDFVLQINPEQLTQDEIFAIQVTPTFSGVLVEHQGTTLKDITISGTTGISPRRAGKSGAYPQNGRPVAGDGVSGYEEFHNLRNYIRAYVEAKRSDRGSNGGELRLIWDNFKDHESLYVEPQQFQMKRSAQKPFMYDYTIKLKGIGQADTPQKNGNWLSSIDSALEVAQDYMDSFTKILEGGSDFISKIDQEFMSTVYPLMTSIGQALNAGGNLYDNLRDITIGNRIINRFTVEELRDRIRATRDNAYDAILGSQISAYNEAKGRTATLQAEVVRQNNEEIKTIKGLVEGEKALTKVLGMRDQGVFRPLPNREKEKVNTYYKLAKNNKVRSAALASLKNLTRQLNLAKAAGNQAAVEGLQRSLDSLLASINQAAGRESGTNVIDVTATTTKEVTLQGGLTIQKVAAIYLGDAKKFSEIVTINKLKAPYVESALPDADSTSDGDLEAGDDTIKLASVDGFPSAGHVLIGDEFVEYTEIEGSELVLKKPLEEDHGTGSAVVLQKSPGVLYPGDKIKIPQASGDYNPPTGVQDNGRRAFIQNPLSEAQYNLGTDLELTESFDIAIDVNKDAALEVSVGNLAQAIVTKLLIQPGELTAHPQIGTNLSIGRKALNVSLVSEQIRKSLSTDTRIESVIFVETIQESSSVKVNMILKVIDIDQPLSIPVELPNRFVA